MPESDVLLPCFGSYCHHGDLLVGLNGLRVTAVERDDGDALTVTVTVTVEPMPQLWGARRAGWSLTAGDGCVGEATLGVPRAGMPVTAASHWSTFAGAVPGRQPGSPKSFCPFCGHAAVGHGRSHPHGVGEGIL